MGTIDAPRHLDDDQLARLIDEEREAAGMEEHKSLGVVVDVKPDC